MLKRLLCVLAVCLAAGDLRAAEVILLGQPCRVLDSRADDDGTDPIPQDGSLPFSLSGTATNQGGVAGCGIPETATSAKLIVHGWPTSFDGGYMKVFNGAISPSLFASLTLQDPNQPVSIQLDVPVAQPSRVVVIEAIVDAHAVVEIAGWNEPCVPEDTFALTYSETASSISVPESGDVDLAKYWHGDGSAIWVGGAASQAGRYEITGTQASGGRQHLIVEPTPESATDVGLEVHLLSGGCSPRETALDGGN